MCEIDFTSGIVVYDQLVKPTKPHLGYLTRFVFRLLHISKSNSKTVDAELPTHSYRWSDITAETLAPITTTLAQVQSTSCDSSPRLHYSHQTHSRSLIRRQIQIPDVTNTHHHDSSRHPDSPRALPGIRLQSSQTRPPTVYRHCPPLPLPAGAALKTRSCVAQEVVWTGDLSSSTPKVRPEAP